MTVSLQRVASIPEISECIATFNDTAHHSPTRVLRILRQTSYWVFEKKTRVFGPSKFVGFSKMTFEAYEAAIHGDWSGERFDGHATRAAIEAATGLQFTADRELGHLLVKWGEQIIGPGALTGVDESKWCFLQI